MLKSYLSSTRKSKFGSKANKRLLIIFFINMLLLIATPLKSSAFNNFAGETTTIDSIIDPDYTIDAIPFPESQPIRVAIYDEQNMTAPSYDTSGGSSSNNISNLVNILSVNEQIEFTIVSALDINNRVLTTADFDVFAMVDNNPREYITNMVNDFWLAGGGIITFDGAAVFLNYFGILPPEAATTSGLPLYWDFDSEGFNITARHPIAKAYDLETSIKTKDTYGYCSWDWSILSGSAIADDLTPVAYSFQDANEISVLAFEPMNRGGKVVTIGFDLNHEEIPELDQLIRDSVDWLTPRPKAKIAFDMSHKPHASIDTWDTYSTTPGKYSTMRDLFVGSGYTVDKLYGVPSGDNFTIERLSKYDMLICVAPNLNYTSGEVVAVENWVANGGSLLAVSDNPTIFFTEKAKRMNYLTNPYGMVVIPGSMMNTIFTDFVKHPTTEGVSDINFPNYGYINITGSAELIWSKDPHTNIVVASNEHGEGRVVYTSDLDWFQESYIGNSDNEQFILNLANWLSAATADVLIYSDGFIALNIYNCPLALALNDLGINYYLTSYFDNPKHDYFNMLLNKYDWDMVIINNPSQAGLDNYLNEIESYVDSGGKLIMSYFNVDNDDTHPLWAKLGFEYVSTFTNEPPVYIWDSDHPIFNQPFDYNAANFSYGNSFTDDGDRLSVLPNGIPLAGLTTTETTGEAIIVLRNDEQTLYNGYLIDEYTIDIDDSTYADNFELWKNEIAFMMCPKLEYNFGTPTEATVLDTIQVNVSITNQGLSAAELGFIDISIPVGLGNTTDNLSNEFNIHKGATHEATWTINTQTVGNYTISFESSYQGYLGTIYSVTFELDISITTTTHSGLNLPWYYYVIGGGVLLIIILIIVVATVVSKKKKASQA